MSRVNKDFTELLRTLSQDENLVENRRQDLSSHLDFEPKKAFALIDVDDDGDITAQEVQTFLLKNRVDADLKDIQDLIYDYDSNNDGRLGIEEFSQLTLPSTNPYLRSAAERRRFSYSYRATDPLPLSCVDLLVRLFEKELAL